MMTRTVTYDETQWKLMPIEPTEEMIGADIEPLYGMDMALAYKTMLNYAPPYPESNCKEILDSWIPVSARLPEQGSYICAAKTDYGTFVGSLYLNGKEVWEHDNEPVYFKSYSFIVTHWMPLPSAPNGEENE